MSTRRFRSTRTVGALGLILAAVLVALFVWPGLPRGEGELSIVYPFDGSVFPPEIIPPVVWWEDADPDAESWRVVVRFEGGAAPIEALVDTTAWTPDASAWELIKRGSVEQPAVLTVSRAGGLPLLGRGSPSDRVALRTATDSVGAPIFYRDVPLPFRFALRNVPMIKWRLGNVASPEPPPTVMTDLPVCGNCHSFSANGSTLGMDVDLGSDKGAYAHTAFEPVTVLSREKLISWSDFVRGDPVPTFGFLPRVSPDGRHVLAGVKDRAVFLSREDIFFSQIFFPVMGILAYYDHETRRIEALPGADDETLVQTNGVWTPDGQTVIFARAKAAELSTEDPSEDIVLTLEESAEVLGGEEFLFEAQERGNRFRFDLYRMSFNGGRGGGPEPIPGASDNGMSNYFPKVSPDGKWIVFTQAHSFMLLQPDSRLWIIPAEGGEPREMNANTSRMNSWHSWSPNSRWLVFSSKVFGPYTQLMLTHVDETGADSPPVLLHNFTDEYRTANIPEFVNIPLAAVRLIEQQFVDDYSYFRSGRIYEQFQEYDRAEQEFTKSLALNPENTFSLYSLASIHRQQEEFDEAIAAYQAVLEIDPGSSVVHEDLGSLYFELERYEEAETEFMTAVHLDPGNFEAGFNLGAACLAQDKIDEGETAFRRLLDLELESEVAARVHDRLAAIHIMKGENDQAVRELKALLAAESDNASARYNLGLAYRSLGRVEEAQVEFEAALRLEPEDMMAIMQLGELHVERGDPASARYYFERAVELDAANQDALRQLAGIQLETGDLASAEEWLMTILASNPRDAWALWSLGRVYYETRRFDLAAQVYGHMTELSPTASRLWFVLAETLVQMGGSAPEAITALERGLSLDPSYLAGHVTLGDLYVLTGDLSGALRQFETALQLGPEDAALVSELNGRIADLRRRIR
jgi:tetratricopeptide (TPR) repeat protein